MAQARPPLSLTNPSQLLHRHLARLPAGRVLVVNFPADDFLAVLQQTRPDLVISAFGFDWPAHQSAAASAEIQPTLHFGAFYQTDAAPFAAILLFLPKSRPLLDMTLAMLAPCLALGAPLWLVGENRAGIRTSQTALTHWIGPARVLDTGRHCAILSASQRQAAAPFQPDAWITTYALDDLSIQTLPGVFSHGRLDVGTQILLETLTEAPASPVLDLGCGAGVIGATIKQRWPASKITLTDASALALEATRRTFAANGLQAEALIASDLFQELPTTYATIISNPPFHNGVTTDHSLVTDFVRGAARHVRTNGLLRFVTGRTVKIWPTLQQNFAHCRVVAEAQGFVVYEASA